ncbi:MAG: hypothetical protein JXM73_15065 [Anaerolineae bacterium]|nr:hypothetical protein [Anaerolineae bacterium]
MDKDIGFNRNIYRAWLDAAAAFCAETDDLAEVRARLEPVVEQDIKSAVNRRKAIDILINIWGKSADLAPGLHREASLFFRSTPVVQDRLWLHYGLTLLAYPFFREVAAAVGQLGRREQTITPAMVKERLIAERGELGSLAKAVERVLFSLRNWELMTPSEQRYAYAPQIQALATDHQALQLWLLACTLHAHPAEELPFADLLRLPELFPFRLTVGVEDLRQHSAFALHRQGDGWDMVRLLPNLEEKEAW